MNTKTAVLLMAFGTPLNTEQLLPYYTDIRHGHAPSADLLAALAARYEAIGGLSPLAKITDDQVAAIDQLLHDRQVNVKVVLALAHIAPKIATVVDQLVAGGITKIYGLPLAAQFSTFNSRSYHQVVKTALASHPEVEYHPVDGFGDQPSLVNYWARQLRLHQDMLNKPETTVLFSAHSLPVKVLSAGDPYKENVEKCVHLVAKQAGLASDQYTLGWQSAGKTGDSWIGPRFEDVASQLLKDGKQQIISVPLDFINNNLEINYDVDIALRKEIDSNGGQLLRLPMPNANSALATAVCDRLMDAGLK